MTRSIRRQTAQRQRRIRRRIRRLTAKEQQERILKIIKSKPQTVPQIGRRTHRSPRRIKFYLTKLQRSTKLRAQGRIQRINRYYHFIEKARPPQRPERPPEAPERKLQRFVMRAAFNSGTGRANLEIDIIVNFLHNLALGAQDPEFLRVRNLIEEVVCRKFGKQGKQIVYSPNFRLSPVPLREGESTTDRWKYRHNGGVWYDFY